MVELVWSWPVVGAVVIFIAGAGIKIMNPPSPIIADFFFLAAGGLFLCKFLTWGQARRHTRKNLISALAIGCTVLVVAVAILGNHYLHRPKDKISTSLVNSIIGGPYFAYSPEKEDLYLISVLVCINLVNEENVYSRIDNYFAQLSLDGEWITLQRILISKEGKFYSVGDLHKGRSYLIEFKYKTIDEQISRTDLKPGETITGVMMFYFKKEYVERYNLAKKIKMKLTFLDSLRHKEEHLLDVDKKPPTKDIDPAMGWFNPFGFTIKEKVDLSKFHIKNAY